jgi:hypothetical protein
MSKKEITDEQLQAAIDVLKNGGLFKDAVAAAGVARGTLHRRGITRRKYQTSWSR